MARLRDRSTGDLLVLMIAGTVCGGLVATGVVGAVFAFAHPEANLEGPARYIADVTNTLIGLLAGFLAGASTASSVVGRKKPEPPSPDGS
jgi:hypothetical protein